MFIERVKLNNFKSLSGEHDINFNDLQGVWWVSGPIGSGKTTLGEAIIFGLFGSISGKNNKDLITWGEKHSVVEVWCKARNNSIYIKRENNSYGQSPLYVEVNGEPVDFTNKRDAQSQLEQEYLDATRTTMELLCIISFNNFKSLSTLNTKDTKQFLDYVLGLDILTSYIDACKDEQSSLRIARSNCTAEKQARTNQILRMQSIEFVDGDIEHENKKLKECRKKVEDLKKYYDPQISDIQSQLDQKRIRLAEVKTLGQAKKREIDFIKKGVCPTCGAPIDQTHLGIKESERENLLKQYTEINTDISRISSHIQEIKQEMSNSIAQQETACISHEKTIAKLQEQSRHKALNESELQKLQLEVDELTLEQEKIDKDNGDYDTIVQCLSTTVREKVMESFIPAINNKIKEISSFLRMPYVPEFDLSFKCYIKNGTQSQIPSSSLSTGQLKMVDTVIILAMLSSVITKVHSNVIFLDELFSNLDYNTRTDLLVILKQILPLDSSIIIVSHQDMEVELIDGHIKMRLENKDGKLQSELHIERNKNEY